MPLHPAAQDILDRCFAETGWQQNDATWRQAVFALTDMYIDAAQHGYIVRLEEISAWGVGRGWRQEHTIALVQMAHTVHYALIRAGVIER